MLRRKRLTKSFERRSGIRNADICELARGFYPSDARLGAATRGRTVSRPDLPDAAKCARARVSIGGFPPSDSSPGPTYRRGDEGAAPVLDLHSAGTRCRALSTDALSRKRGGSRSPFAFSAFNAFAQPMLTSSLCSLRHA